MHIPESRIWRSKAAKRADAGNIQPIGWFVEQKILRRVEDGSGERGLHALAL